MIDFDEIRKEVAIRHNVLLDKDDPILVTVTVNDIVLNRYIENVTKQYEAANLALTVNLQQQVEQSKATAGKIITDASNYVSEQIRNAILEAVNEASDELKHKMREAQAASHDTVVSAHSVQTAKKSALISAMIAGISAVVAIVAVITVLLK
ncbi:conjugal transfer protein TraM [Xenorhabdus eapokensis]|uniref:Conjugal transfer protein TraM n=1 Tax=Xenorhabdus eapokensis TaxID=1873482 RepID=A0A1Q5TKS9_9GAMM|nr:conjugal transfer protein TraM [Xenorhabdus eapokensis]OKP00826.1 conjugal transfer protein TraM [Xenorhabdus eapokensis]